QLRGVPDHLRHRRRLRGQHHGAVPPGTRAPPPRRAADRTRARGGTVGAVDRRRGGAVLADHHHRLLVAAAGQESGAVPVRGGRGGGPMGGGAGSIGPNLDCHITRPAPIARLGVLLMLDASASMNDDAGGATCSGGCGATSQWALATSAINTVVGLTASSIDWGLEVFGEAGAACAVGSAVSVPFTAGNSGAIG